MSFLPLLTRWNFWEESRPQSGWEGHNRNSCETYGKMLASRRLGKRVDIAAICFGNISRSYLSVWKVRWSVRATHVCVRHCKT